MFRQGLFFPVLLVFVYVLGILLVEVDGKVVRGVFSSKQARIDGGQLITMFSFHGEGLIKYKLNQTSNGKLYFYIEEKWPSVMAVSQCKDKIAMSQYSHSLTGTEGKLQFDSWSDQYLWYLVYADNVSCDPSALVFADIEFTLELYNPDSKGQASNHFSYDESGLLSFYEILGFLYFACAIMYGQRLWQTIQKGGPMHLVIKVLTKAMMYHGAAVFCILIHFFRYSGDGIGYTWIYGLSTVLQGFAEYEMLSMMARLCIGYTLSSSCVTGDPQVIRHMKIGVAVVSSMKVLLEILGVTLAVILLQLVIAVSFSFFISRKINEERSSLRKEFYSKFIKGCLVWILAFPVLVFISSLLAFHRRLKVLTWGQETARCAVILWLYRLFLSRSLYWEVSSLSASTLPLRHDKGYGNKNYNSEKRTIGIHKSVFID
ncbi:integral membrane protein GPR180 [Nematostella vectensis]|uniref:integral membrane protein GPR180 n=1 Tax=Nematostella vectensis TaxID=45351 RepID=UPI002077998B|nr:integral membrane protein GPR180 [Nematostella vectensis]